MGAGFSGSPSTDAVGITIMEKDAQKFWDRTFFPRFREIAYRAGATPESPYPFYEIRRDHVLAFADTLPPGRVLDVGCGGADVLIALLRLGWAGEGRDFSDNMVALARERLAAADHDPGLVRPGRATALSDCPDGAFDMVLCLGPIEYLDEDEAARAYAGMRRVLRRDGHLVCAHINRLFDLFTWDGFSADLMMAMIDTVSRPGADERREIRRLLKARLGLDARPEQDRGAASLRASVPTRSDNPLTVRAELERHGFVLSRTAFYRFHGVPPFVARRLPRLGELMAERERAWADDWHGHFLASSFLTFSRRA